MRPTVLHVEKLFTLVHGLKCLPPVQLDTELMEIVSKIEDRLYGAYNPESMNLVSHLIEALFCKLPELNQISKQRVQLESIFAKVQLSAQYCAKKNAKIVRFQINTDMGELKSLTAHAAFFILTQLSFNSIIHGFINQSQGKISITSKWIGDDLQLSYFDNGVGTSLTSEQIFTHGHSSLNQVSEFSGRGVGMKMIQSMTEQFSGSISFKSSAGAGVELYLYLPDARADQKIQLKAS